MPTSSKSDFQASIMNGVSKGTAAIGLVLAAVLAGGLIGWLASRGPVDAPAPGQRSTLPPTTPASPSRTENPAPPRVAPDVRPAATATTNIAQDLSAPNSPAPVPAAIPDWEKRIEEIIESKVPDVEKAKRIAALFPRLPQEGQIDAAELITDLLPDAEYALAAQMLTNAAFSESVLDVLMTDLLGRPEKMKLSLLLDVARNSAHAKAEEARDFLELYLEKDYGDDWAKWEKAAEEWLKANPE